MKKQFHCLCLILLLLTVCAAAASCSNTPVNDPSKQADTTSAAVETETQPAETDDMYDPKLPKTDYENHEFKVLQRLSASTSYYNEMWLYRAELNGEVINDAIVKRNRNIEEKYNIKIATTEIDSPATQIRTEILAGSCEYDAVFDRFGSIGGGALNSNYVNLHSVPYLDFSKPYWDSNADEELTLEGKIYGMVSDISLMTLHYTRAITFNRDLIKLYNLDDPYELVKNDQWTFDKMCSMITAVSDDLNGDGKRDYNDRFGMLTEPTGGTSNILGFVVGGGIRFTTQDADGNLIISFTGEKTMDIIAKWKAISDNASICLDYGTIGSTADLTSTNGSKWVYGRTMFAQDKFLFTQSGAYSFDDYTNAGMESEYGIVPNPKIDASQTEYYHKPDKYGTTVAIPVSNHELERTGMILEDWAYQSMLNVLPAYYDTTIKLKRAQVPELGEMMDIIKNSILYEVCDVYNIDIGSYVVSAFSSGNPASIFATVSKVMDKQLAKVVESVKALG